MRASLHTLCTPWRSSSLRITNGCSSYINGIKLKQQHNGSLISLLRMFSSGWRHDENTVTEYQYEYASDAVSAWRSARKILRSQGVEPSQLNLADLLLKNKKAASHLNDKTPSFPGRFYTVDSPFELANKSDSSNTPGPIVFLFGWNFSSKRQLKKYTDWYFERGFSRAVVFRPTLFHTYSFFKPIHVGRLILSEIGRLANLPVDESKIREMVAWNGEYDSEKLQRDLASATEMGKEAATDTKKPKIIFHIFSGSCYLYLRQLHLMETFPEYAKLKSAIDAVVFDSTPIEDTARNGADAVVSASRYVPRLIRPLLYSTFWSYWHISSILYPLDGELKGRFWDMLGARSTLTCPVKFMYSRDDAIAPYSFIQMQQDKMRSAGVDASGHCFPARPAKRQYPAHVTHFIQTHDTYTEVMQEHLGKVGIDFRKISEYKKGNDTIRVASASTSTDDDVAAQQVASSV